jgi:hypothetical protein
MDLGIIIAFVVLIVWAVGALVMQGPGWIHLLLTVGVSLLIFRIVVSTSGESSGRRSAEPRAARHGTPPTRTWSL